MLEGALNPLRFTQENVVGEFEKLRLCDVSAVVAANERAPLSTHALGVGGEDNRLDDFFPFDPLLLKRAAAMVAPLYQLWRPIAGEERGSNMSELLSESQESGSAPLEPAPTPLSVALPLSILSEAEQAEGVAYRVDAAARSELPPPLEYYWALPLLRAIPPPSHEAAEADAAAGGGAGAVGGCRGGGQGVRGLYFSEPGIPGFQNL